VGHNKQISGELRIIFVQSVKIYSSINFYLLSKRIHFLCTTSLIISYKNQPLLLSLGGCLEKKIGKKVGHNTQISGELLFIFLQSVKIYSLISIYSPKGCTSYVPQV